MHERLKELRKSLHLTQQEFANKLGITRSTVATYEMGKSNPSDAAISLICNKFNVNETWLRTGVGDPYIETDPDTVLMQWAGRVLSSTDESFQKRFVDMLSKLNDQDWSTLEKIAILLYNSENGKNT